MLWLGVDCRRTGCRRCWGSGGGAEPDVGGPGVEVFAYRLDQKVSGVSRLAVTRQAAARRAAERAASPGRGLPPERVRAVLDQLAAGLNPNQARPAAGVSESFVYRLHHTMGGAYRRYGGNQLLGPHAAGLGGTETVQVTR